MSHANTHQFFVDTDGRLHETSTFETLARLKDLFPDLDEGAMEAEITLERSHRLMALDRDARWAPLGLTGSRFILLRSLYSAPEKRLNMGQIAAQMNLEPNNVTQLIDSLVRQGWVAREASEEDRRVVYAALTPEGEALFCRAMAEAAERTSESFGVLSQRERQMLVHLLAKLRMHLLTNPLYLDEDHSSDLNRAARTRRRRSSARP